MNTESKRVEVLQTTNYVRGYMAYVWAGGHIVQIFSGGSKRDVEGDAAQWLQMYRSGLL